MRIKKTSRLLAGVGSGKSFLNLLKKNIKKDKLTKLKLFFKENYE
jgi:hypothetical protein